MKDGIYRVDFNVANESAKGIAMLSNGVFKGVDQTHVYSGTFASKDGKISGKMTSIKYPSLEHDYVSIKGGEFVVTGKEEEGAFEAERDTKPNRQGNSRFLVPGSQNSEVLAPDYFSTGPSQITWTRVTPGWFLTRQTKAAHRCISRRSREDARVDCPRSYSRAGVYRSPLSAEIASADQPEPHHHAILG